MPTCHRANDAPPFKMYDVVASQRNLLCNYDDTDAHGDDDGYVECVGCRKSTREAHQRRIREVARRRRCSRKAAAAYVAHNYQPRQPNVARVFFFPCMCRLYCRACERRRHIDESQYVAITCPQCRKRITGSIESRYLS